LGKTVEKCNKLSIFISGDDAATANTSGYGALSSNQCYCISLIESLQSVGGNSMVISNENGVSMFKELKEKAKKYWQGWSLKNGLFQPEAGLTI